MIKTKDKHSKDTITIGCVYENPNNRPASGRGCVYDTNGIAPTILTMAGGGNKPCVIVRRKDEQNYTNREHKEWY